jgi:hypothetical protein
MIASGTKPVARYEFALCRRSRLESYYRRNGVLVKGFLRQHRLVGQCDATVVDDRQRTPTIIPCHLGAVLSMTNLTFQTCQIA